MESPEVAQVFEEVADLLELQRQQPFRVRAAEGGGAAGQLTTREGSAMSTARTRQYTLTLTEEERAVLQDVLEEVLKTTQLEEHRTEAFQAKAVVRARELTVESLLQKTRSARPNGAAP
jgi:hypothetical protein